VGKLPHGVLARRSGPSASKLVRLVAALTIIALVSAACGGGGSNDTSGGGGSAGGDTLDLVAADFAFDPSELEAEPGAEMEVSFTNEDDTDHSFTSDDLGVDVVVEGGGSGTVSFTAPDSGSAKFVCKFHDQMVGEIVTGGGGASGDGGGTTDNRGGY
jgi:plastocyanin